jgi:ribosomal protein S18 acetylase RimI-like enzyme
MYINKNIVEREVNIMNKNFEIIELKEFTSETLEELSLLLMDVVNLGASVGFLAPLSLEDAKEFWSKVLSDEVILFVGKVDGKIIGTIQLHLCMKQNGKHRAEIAKLLVQPNVRRMGIGKALMETAERRAVEEKRSIIILDTRAGEVSNLLYKSKGYIEAGRIPKYAESTEGGLHDTVIYYKNIE